MKLFLISIISTLLLIGCSSPKNNVEKNLEKLDKQYGFCDNPHRNLTPRQYRICKDAERASSGEDFKFDPDSITEKLIKSLETTGLTTQSMGQTLNVNEYLWNGSLQALEAYPIKNIDSSGGYIETEWIAISKNPNQRCIIKINITSKELVSNGVSAKIICQNKENDQWLNDQNSYMDESKQLTIKILNNASEFYQNSLSN